MATPTLPTRIRMNIRDHVTSPESKLAVKFKALTATLGYPVTFDPEWIMLWKTLQAFYPDPATFVPNIAGTIVTWSDAFTSWLETEENEENVDKLLDALKSKGRLDLVIEIASGNSTRPTTAWRANKSVFVIAFPKAEPCQQSTVLAGFAGELVDLFAPSPTLPAKNLASSTKNIAGVDEDWADLDLGAPESHPSLPTRSPQRSVDPHLLEEDPMPDVSTIQRPEELLRRPPYWITVHQEGRMKVVVQGSHSPSLACLDEYLRRWCRGEVNRADRPPMVEIKLRESTFGLGLMHDTLTMEAIRGREVSAMLVLAFVESVLGYQPLPSSVSPGCVWEFKRTKGFKS